MANHINTSFDIDGNNIRVKIYKEIRKSVRISVGKNCFHLRIPRFISAKEEKKYYLWAKDWIIDQFKSNPKIRNRFTVKSYHSGDKIEVMGDVYTLNISYRKAQNHKGRMKDNDIILQLCHGESGKDLETSIKTLLSRLCASKYKEDISNRVDFYNDRYFQKEISAIRLKYNMTNWGSCSTKSNLNFSTRILFAPNDVRDYIIVHELAHLIEMNHSTRFWDIVKGIIPDYKSKEKWLKVHGHLCDF